MTKPPRPQFLARESYRLRRLMDAMRVLPVVGVVLLFLPLMREEAEATGPAIAQEAVFLFAVWGGLIVVALLMSRGVRHVLDAPPQGDIADPPAPED